MVICVPSTQAACPTLSTSTLKGNLVFILQGALYCKGYNPNGFDGVYSNGVSKAIVNFKTDAGLLVPDEITTPMILKALLNMDGYVLGNGDPQVRIIQQMLIRNYSSKIGLVFNRWKLHKRYK